MISPLSRNTFKCAAQSLGIAEPSSDQSFSGVSTDTRTIQSGDLFVALKGPNFDGHDYVGLAEEKGASGLMVSHPVSSRLPQLIVADTRLGLGQLAAARRLAFRGKVVGITGSNGKTTVKGMVAAVLGRSGTVLATQGNFNNDIGMPLTLLKLEHEDEFAVIEMGANHIGEIDYLTHISRPDVALITCAGAAHLEGFGSLDGVAKGKGEIYSGLMEGGIAIVNRDDRYADYWLDLNKERNIVCFGMDERADVRAVDISQGRDGSMFTLLIGEEQLQVHLSLFGEHNVRNALAAAAVGYVLDVPLEEIKLALEAFDAVSGRLKLCSLASGASLLDDTYNANPDSFKAGINSLVAFAGRHVLVMGDMAEVGSGVEEAHREIGRFARTHGVEHLLSVGKYAALAAEGFGTGGQSFASQEELVKALGALLAPDVTILVKGSRSSRMERIVQSLLAQQQ
ncbi:MAG: UDP-N-acetylmuramoyl-tripeptide--D-alanyl-D-alanine ligase [Gammaproteobacteria bacterium]|nr:UDP-N-acetylmuramoyl-tripeptide--D-alanyl-D-alanine ligase [Gammaproteobacteria bacterium]